MRANCGIRRQPLRSPDPTSIHPLHAVGTVTVLLAAVLLTLNFLANIHTLHAEETGLKVPAEAPSFVLETMEGEEVVVSHDFFHEQKLTVLLIWNSECPECLHALLETAAYAPRADSLGATILSINFDQDHMAEVRAFIEGEELPFPVLWDPNGEVAAAYQAEDYSLSIFLVDSTLNVRYLHYDSPEDVRELLEREIPKAMQPLFIIEIEESGPESQEEDSRSGDTDSDDVPDSEDTGDTFYFEHIDRY